MTMLEKYLHAVRFFLPKGSQDDIVRELSDNLLSQFEDREEALGRSLTEDEQADILRRHGHPMIVAGRYRSHQYLIGPVFFPMYTLALKMGMAVALLVTVVLTAVSAVEHSGDVRSIVDGLLAYPGRALMVFAWTTLGFVGLDYVNAQLKLSHSWDPRTLPNVPAQRRWSQRFDAIAELIASCFALVWLLSIPSSPFLIMGPFAAVLSLAPIWTVMYLPAIAVLVATIVLSAITAIQPQSSNARSMARVALHTASTLVFLVLLRAGEWVVVKPGADSASAERLGDLFNLGFRIGLPIAVVIALIDIARELYRWLSRRSATPLGHAGAL